MSASLQTITGDHRRLAAEFEVRALQGFRSGLQDFLPGDDIAGQRHHADFRVTDQVAANAFTTATNDVDHAARQDLRQCGRQGQNRQRRVLGRFEHQRIAGGEGGGDFPRGHHDRVIPRRDGRNHPNRIAAHHAGVTRQVFATELAGLAAHGTGEEAEYVDRRAQVVLTGQVQGFAAVQGFEAGEQVGLFFDGVGNVQQQVRALLRRGPRPTGERTMGREDRGFDLLGAGFGDVRQHLAGGRIEDRFDKTLTRDQFAIDQQRGEQRGLRASHFSGSLFLCGHAAPSDWGRPSYRCTKTSARTRGRQILNTEGGVRLNRWLASAVGLLASDRQKRVHQRRARRAAAPGQADVEGLAEIGDGPRFDDVALQ